MELIQNTECKEWQRDKALIICNENVSIGKKMTNSF